MEYGEVMGKCRDCIGCEREGLPWFKGVFCCPNYIKYIKEEKENSEDEKI